ncbi:MAG: DNA mismatch repair endonuclease MutL [Verrucomicrobia bacterium]|nr:DNA mismatch repair endonuclease MutL [Verrucomicrobiota bacterium]
MSCTIHLLSEETINQIAAGEVIENPASVIKELIENGLDAGATKICVEVTGGGLKLIRVSDDGKGMNREDAHLSIVRHATSKIRHAQDLFHIATMGFRGEALASIASISKMTLMTAQEGQVGTELEIEKGEVIKESSFARTRGTTIEVRSLFYNVPARKKFQKSAVAISADIFRVMTVMSLGHPNVQFELISNGRKVLKTMTQGVQERAKELLGDEFVSGSHLIEFQEGPLLFSGLIGSPTNTRANKMGQYLYMNRRAVVSSQISEAVREGYATRLEERRHPIFLLNLNVPTDLIDVNVHPQKLHVRLRKEELFRNKVSEAITRALAKTASPRPLPSFHPIEVRYEAPLLREEPPELEQGLLLEEKSSVEVLGQVGRFICLREGEKWVFLDTEAARFRVIFENLIQKENSKAQKQLLLVPFTIDLTSVEAAMVLTHLDAIENLGFELRSIGKSSFMIEAIPPFVDENDVKQVIAEMALHLQEFIGKHHYAEERQKKLAQCAARFARRKSHVSNEEARQLYERLQKTGSPLHCPKGNPTMVHLDHDAIEYLFRADQKTAKSPKG